MTVGQNLPQHGLIVSTITASTRNVIVRQKLPPIDIVQRTTLSPLYIYHDENIAVGRHLPQRAQKPLP